MKICIPFLVISSLKEKLPMLTRDNLKLSFNLLLLVSLIICTNTNSKMVPFIYNKLKMTILVPDFFSIFNIVNLELIYLIIELI